MTMIQCQMLKVPMAVSKIPRLSNVSSRPPAGRDYRKSRQPQQSQPHSPSGKTSTSRGVEADAHLGPRNEPLDGARLGHEIGIQPLNRHIEQVDLAEKVPRHDAAGRAAGFSAQLQEHALRADRHGHRPPFTAANSGKRPDARDCAAGEHRPLQFVQMAEEAGHEQALRPVVKILGVALLDDAAAAHQHDAVAHTHRLLRIVGDDKGGGAGFAQDGQRVGTHAVAKPAVQPGEGLVHQQDAGPRNDGAGKRDTLLLAAGSFVRIGIGQVLQPDPGKRSPRLLLARPPVERRQAEHDVSEDGEVREQRIILEHQTDAPPLRRHEHLRRSDFQTIDENTPGARHLDAGGDAQECRLAAAGMAEQRDDLTGFDIEAHVFQRSHPAKTPRDLLQGETRSDRCGGAPSPGARDR